LQYASLTERGMDFPGYSRAMWNVRHFVPVVRLVPNWGADGCIPWNSIDIYNTRRLKEVNASVSDTV